MTKLRERIEAVHDVLARKPVSGLTGRPRGALSWFQHQVYMYFGWKPGTTTIHRWVSGETSEPREELTETLITLEHGAAVARKFQDKADEMRR